MRPALVGSRRTKKREAGLGKGVATEARLARTVRVAPARTGRTVGPEGMPRLIRTLVRTWKTMTTGAPP
jgi:hypothetical protein